MITTEEQWGHFTLVSEIEPSGSRWLPWRGRMSRWWYEIQVVTPKNNWSLAFSEGGSGGAFTLRRCMVRASEAMVDLFDESKSLADEDAEKCLKCKSGYGPHPWHDDGTPGPGREAWQAGGPYAPPERVD